MNETPIDRIKKGTFLKTDNREQPEEITPPYCKNCAGYGEECTCKELT